MDAADAIARAGATPAITYSDAKRALALWLRRAAGTPEWGGAGILLNGISPGLVDTAMTRTAYQDAQMEGLMKGAHPVATGRYGQPEELAEVADFLLNLEGGYMLGQILFVDGGADAIS
jgi:NAD(P)-dependent dehydrogenase (short-subunit alcohol dehydrogenase family)